MSTEFLRRHTKALADFAEQARERSSSAPEDFWMRLAAQNQTQAAGDALRELKLVEAEEAGELFDLRFMGPEAQGSILLDTFIKIAEPLSKAWKYAAYRLRNGVEQSGRDDEISSLLNLKLAGIAYGSTRILMTGNGRADLAGVNLLQSTFTQTFRLLTVNNEGFFDAVDAMGGKAAHQIAESIKAIDNSGLSVEFSWNSPSGKLVWEGGKSEILRVKSLLLSLQEPEHYIEELTGHVAGLRDTGLLELRTENGKVSVRFPLKLTEQVQRLSLAKPAKIQVKTARYWDAIQKRDVFKRQMISLIE